MRRAWHGDRGDTRRITDPLAREGGRLRPPSFLFESAPPQPFLFGDLRVETGPSIPRLPAFPIRYEERVAHHVHRPEEKDGRAQKEKSGWRILHDRVGQPHTPRANDRQG